MTLRSLHSTTLARFEHVHLSIGFNSYAYLKLGDSALYNWFNT